METLLQDVRYALRAFRSGHSGLLVAAAVLAIALGAGTTTFSVVSGVLLRSLPFTEPERLVNVRVAPLEGRTDRSGGATMSERSVELALSGTGAFESAAYLRTAGGPVLTGLGEPERLDHVWGVAPGFFSVLGSPPLLGRPLTAGDAGEGGGRSVVLSHRFWASRFGGAPDVVGRTLTLDGRDHEIVGVMPPGFDFPEGAQLWRPAPPLEAAGSEIQGRYWLVGRLAPGVSLEQAQARLDARFAAYAREQPEFARWGPNLAPLHELLVGPVRKPLLLLLGAVALVLLLACANVAAVLLARGITRRRELAIRLSVGASRGRVARQLLTEAVLLALLSGAGGVLLAVWAVPLLLSLVGDQLPRAAEVALDGRVLAVTVAASTLTGLAAGLFPALLVAKEDVSAALKDGSIGAGTSSWRIRVGEGLVVLQVGLGTLLLAGAMLLGLSFWNLMRVDFGFEPSRVATAHLRLPSERYTSPEQRRLFAAEVLERARALPGVQAAAASDGVPFDGAALGSIGIPGEEIPPSAPWAWLTGVTPDYFRVLGLELVRGRAFRSGGREDGSPVVVNQAFARAFFPGRDPVGRSITYYGDVRGEIVGVVTDVRQSSVQEPAPPQIYTPFEAGSRLKVSLRSTEDAARAAAALKGIIRSVDPLLPIDRLGVLSDLITESVARQRFYAVVLGSFAVIALLITALGMYALTAYSVSRRTREIGIRIAVGASTRQIRAMTIGRTAVLAGAGVALGLVGAAMATRALEALVFGLSTTDPLVFGAVALLLAGVAVLAAYAPARRAARVDPMVVLRAARKAPVSSNEPNPTRPWRRVVSVACISGRSMSSR